MPRRVSAAAVVVAALALAAACVGTGATSSPGATSRGNRLTGGPPHVPAGLTDTAEVVMGTLTAPPTRAFLARVRHGKMGGVLLLGNDWLSRRTAAAVTAKLRRAACNAGEPPLIAVDQEGGIVKRLAWAPPTEAPADMKSPADARAQAAGAAAALKSVGIDVDFAPVLGTPASSSNFLGSRAFSRSATRDARMGRAFVRGLQQNGVAATAKHFPGLGLAGGNTDNGRIVIDAPVWKIRKGLVPFKSAIRAGVQLVMVGTAIYPALDPSRKPAAFSKKIIEGLLRKQLHFTGVTVTDSLTAPAPEAIPHAASRAVLAGSDLLVWGSESASEQGYATLVADAKGSAKLRARLAQAAGRIEALKAWLAAHGGATCPAK